MLGKRFREFLGPFRIEAVEWCRGKNWKWRSVLLFWFVYILFRHLSNPVYTSIVGWLNLGIHELGHLFFSFFGQFICTLGGTIFQCLAPVIGIANFYRQNDFFAIAFCFGWLSTNLFDVSRYVADARAMELPLAVLFGNENVIHDWNYLLGRMGILQFDAAIAFFIRILAVLSMFVCFFFGGWLLWQMKRNG